MKTALLLIGPRKNIKDPDKIGGVIVLFEDLLANCNNKNITIYIIDTNKENYSNKLSAYLGILWSFLLYLPRATHVSLHGTANDFVLIAPLVVMMSKLFRKSISLRKFAGNFIELYEGYTPLIQKVVQWSLRHATCNFFETHYLVAYFKKYNAYTYWFPNVRERQEISTDSSYQKRFIFIGAISYEKGIETLCQASNLLDDSYRIDIYGKFFDGYTQEYFSDYNVQYCGVLRSEDVINTLQQYDILLLPSYREGYPGVIIEALSVGLPIVATSLEGIKEMVNEESSVLIDTGNIEQLYNAIVSFNSDNYAEKSRAAKQQFDHFDSEIQTSLFLKRIGL